MAEFLSQLRPSPVKVRWKELSHMKQMQYNFIRISGAWYVVYADTSIAKNKMALRFIGLFSALRWTIFAHLTFPTKAWNEEHYWVHPLLQSKTRYLKPSPNYLTQCQGIGYSDSFQPAQMTFLPVVCLIANYLCCLSLVCSFHLTLSDAQTVNNASFMLLQPVLLMVCLLGRRCMSE